MRLFTKVLILGAFSLIINSCATKTEVEPEVTGPVEPRLHSLIAENNTKELSQLFNINLDVDERDSMGRTALHVASKKGNIQMINRLILIGAEIDPLDKENKTPLILAIENNQIETAAILANHGSNIHQIDSLEKSALDYSMEMGTTIVESIINEKNINQLDQNGYTVLQRAVKKGLFDLIDSLLDKGADTSIKSSLGELAIDFSLENRSSLPFAKVSASLISAGSPQSKNHDFNYVYDVFQNSNFNTRDEYGKTPLHKASEYGHEGFVKLFLENDAELNIQDKPGNTPLHEAVRSGYISIVELLLAKGANVNSEDFNENTALHVSLSVEKNNHIAQLLIEQGANVNSKNSFGNTPLHLTVSLQESKEMAQLLLDNGALLDSRNKSGNTPLLLSVEKDHKEIAQLLLERGADIYAVNIELKTPVEIALNKGNEVIQWFINDKIVNKSDNSGNTILHLAIILGIENQIINQLLSIGAIPDIRNMQGNTPLHEAILLREIDNSQSLLTAGSSLYISNNAGDSPLLLSFKNGPEFVKEILTTEYINRPDPKNNTPLFFAVNWSSAEMVQLLIDLGAQVNIKNLNGTTPLHEVVRSDSIDSAQILISNGADIGAFDTTGNTALHEVVYWDALDLGQLLINRGADLNARNNAGRTPLLEAVNLGKEVVVDFFIRRGSDINATDNKGKTPIFDATLTGNITIVSLLLGNKASLSKRDEKGNTVLHGAIISENKEIAQLLLQKNSDIFALNRTGESPLSIALSQGTETLKWFINDNNINDVNNDGLTALHFAIKYKSSREVISFLIENGGDINSRNSFGQTPAEYAKELNYLELMDLLQ